MGQTRDIFKERLFAIWASYFGFPSVMLKGYGLQIIPQSSLKGTGYVNLYRFDKQLIALCDGDLHETLIEMMQIPSLRNALENGMASIENQSALDKAIKLEHLEWLFYLYPPDFKAFASSNFEIRQLSESDEGALESLHSACTPADVDEAEVSVADELAIGAFDGDKLVACASLYDWRGFGDPGVLVHPDYRKRGLGTAVVSPICQYVLDQGRVMNYRCDSRNTGSAKIAERLGFTQYFEIEVFKLVDHT